MFLNSNVIIILSIGHFSSKQPNMMNYIVVAGESKICHDNIRKFGCSKTWLRGKIQIENKCQYKLFF